jgi:mono/diheme cytochrome c family protein
LLLAVLAALVAGFFIIRGVTDKAGTEPSQTASGGVPIVTGIVVPDLAASEEAGRVAFEANCAKCHGINGAGVDGAGPPLVHIIYEPNHHGDGSFLVAVRNGVRSHHWDFGNMNPLPGVRDDEIISIIGYVRALQRANGIN